MSKDTSKPTKEDLLEWGADSLIAPPNTEPSTEPLSPFDMLANMQAQQAEFDRRLQALNSEIASVQHEEDAKNTIKDGKEKELIRENCITPSSISVATAILSELATLPAADPITDRERSVTSDNLWEPIDAPTSTHPDACDDLWSHVEKLDVDELDFALEVNEPPATLPPPAVFSDPTTKEELIEQETKREARLSLVSPNVRSLYEQATRQGIITTPDDLVELVMRARHTCVRVAATNAITPDLSELLFEPIALFQSRFTYRIAVDGSKKDGTERLVIYYAPRALDVDALGWRYVLFDFIDALDSNVTTLRELRRVTYLLLITLGILANDDEVDEFVLGKAQYQLGGSLKQERGGEPFLIKSRSLRRLFSARRNAFKFVHYRNQLKI